MSLDHCFLGSEEETASHNPFLAMYDSSSKTLFVIAVSSEEYKEWIA